MNSAQKQIDKEVDVAIARVRKSAVDMEKNLEFYRAQALKQKERLEKAIRAKTKKARSSKPKAKRPARKTIRRKN